MCLYRKSLQIASLFALLGLATPSYAYLINLVIDDFVAFQEESAKKISSFSGSITCDSFSTSSNCNITHDPGPGIQVIGAGILGGYRDLYVNTGQVSGSGTRGISAFIDTSSGALIINNDSAVAGTAVVVWDGAHAITADPRIDANIATSGLGGVDFTLSPGSYGVLLDIPSIDLNVNATLDLWDTSGQKASVTYSNLSTGSVVFTFADFLNNNALLNLNQIGAIRLTVTGPAAWDGEFKLIGVTTTPEPATLTLFGLGLLGLRSVFRRQKT